MHQFKFWILAHFTPALVLVGAHALLAAYFLPLDAFWMGHWAAMPDLFKPFALLAPAALIGLLTLILNPALLTLAGGFVGDRIWPLGRLRQRAQVRYAARLARIVAIDEELAKSGSNWGLEQEADELAYTNRLLYPPREMDVVRNALGNALRAVEHYPAQMYGMHHRILWPRLWAVVPPEHAAAVGQARAILDLEVNLTLVGVLLGLDVALLTWQTQRPELLLGALLAGALAYAAYRLAVPAAIAWGQQVKTTYDLYRRDLLVQMELVPPPTLAEETALWVRLSQFMMYWEETDLHFDEDLL
ncbi:MAG: hypothetical protein KKA73_10505 [Chloroflexi bacterium]|nr:hypothetical protein [Chloroflexota bacterium]MBU1748108.1 hypothetical protein [Chloroflexota bacterium]MBU1880065.1 hypothetical protein [Chloroflexota bacterium]